MTRREDIIGRVIFDVFPADPDDPAALERERLIVANLQLVEDILDRRPSVLVIPAMLGRLGIDLAEQHQPDLILLDLHLPDLNGDEVLAALQANPETRGMTVVMLSADATRRELNRLLSLGARAYLTKPIGVRAFLEVVDEYLSAAPSGVVEPGSGARRAREIDRPFPHIPEPVTSSPRV